MSCVLCCTKSGTVCSKYICCRQELQLNEIPFVEAKEMPRLLKSETTKTWVVAHLRKVSTLILSSRAVSSACPKIDQEIRSNDFVWKTTGPSDSNILKHGMPNMFEPCACSYKIPELKTCIKCLDVTVKFNAHHVYMNMGVHENGAYPKKLPFHAFWWGIWSLPVTSSDHGFPLLNNFKFDVAGWSNKIP